MSASRPSKRFLVRLAAAVLIVGAGAVGGVLFQPSAPPQERRIKMTARQYEFDPPVLRVNKGDTVRLRVTSLDVIHGLYMEAFDFNVKIVPDSPYLELSHPSRPDEPVEMVEEVVFVADKSGKFRYRCSHTCGSMHPFMQGEMIVAPNRLLGAGIGGFIGLFLAAALVVTRRGKAKP